MAAKKLPPAPLPPFYAYSSRGLESIAAEEIERELHGEIVKAERGLVVFKLEHVDDSILELRTVDDVFALAWGTDALTHRAVDLKSIQQWTAKFKGWRRILQLHNDLRPKAKGKPTYRIVPQMMGQFAYRRADAGKAVLNGLGDLFPASWGVAEENATVEIWLSIVKERAVCGMRLSDKSMRHRTYKHEHMPASLRPSMAAALVRLAGAGPGMTVLDPMCGAGTILAEQIEIGKRRKGGRIEVWGGDIEMNMLRAAQSNLKKVGPALLARWDAAKLPFGASTVDRIVSNPPFGVQLSSPEEIVPLYIRMVKECNRVLKPGGRAVFLVADQSVLRDAIAKTAWSPMRQYAVEILGQDAVISVWQKPGV